MLPYNSHVEGPMDRWNDEIVHRVEEAPLGLAYVMRKHERFLQGRGDAVHIDVRSAPGAESRHREYEEWTITGTS